MSKNEELTPRDLRMAIIATLNIRLNKAESTDVMYEILSERPTKDLQSLLEMYRDSPDTDRDRVIKDILRRRKYIEQIRKKLS